MWSVYDLQVSVSKSQPSLPPSYSVDEAYAWGGPWTTLRAAQSIASSQLNVAASLFTHPSHRLAGSSARWQIQTMIICPSWKDSNVSLQSHWGLFQEPYPLVMLAVGASSSTCQSLTTSVLHSKLSSHLASRASPSTSPVDSPFACWSFR